MNKKILLSVAAAATLTFTSFGALTTEAATVSSPCHNVQNYRVYPVFIGKYCFFNNIDFHCPTVGIPGIGNTPEVNIPGTDNTPEVNIPGTDNTPEVNVPGTDNTPEVNVPGTDNTPEVNVPGTDNTPEVNVPGTDNTPEVNVPGTDNKPEVSVPGTDNTPEVDVPEMDNTPEVNVPENEQNSPGEENLGTGDIEQDNEASSSDYEVSAFEQKVLELTNAERAKQGLSPLTIDLELSKVARIKSQDMKNQNYFSHNSPTYGSPFDMMSQFGIAYSAAAENIAQGQTTPEEVVQAWMNSQGHRENIMNANYTHIGIGYVAEGHYWTQMFIRK